MTWDGGSSFSVEVVPGRWKLAEFAGRSAGGASFVGHVLASEVQVEAPFDEHRVRLQRGASLQLVPELDGLEIEGWDGEHYRVWGPWERSDVQISVDGRLPHRPARLAGGQLTLTGLVSGGTYRVAPDVLGADPESMPIATVVVPTEPGADAFDLGPVRFEPAPEDETR